MLQENQESVFGRVTAVHFLTSWQVESGSLAMEQQDYQQDWPLQVLKVPTLTSLE